MHLTISSLCSVQLIYQYLQLRKEEDGADPWLEDIENQIFGFKHKIYNCFSEVERESALYGSRRNQSRMVQHKYRIQWLKIVFIFVILRLFQGASKPVGLKIMLNCSIQTPQNLPIRYKCLRSWWRAELLLKRQIDISVL